MESCPHMQDGKVCGQSRYKPKLKVAKMNKPRAQMLSLPIMATIKAMYANSETSTLLRHRDKCLQQALHLFHTASQTYRYSDFCDSQVYMHHYTQMGLFKDSRDVALALSTDGAQLTMKKQSDTWLLILVLLNLPPEICYKSKNIIITLTIPGPRAPGNIESFVYPVFEEMAMASEGIWLWDALDSSYFLNHTCITMILGDMLGSAKLNGMAGHSAFLGDRFSMVQGAHTSLKKGSKAQYYPLAPLESSKYNPNRPLRYNLDALPMRTAAYYWETITKLDQATTKAECNIITRNSGILHMPLSAASPAFLHPSYFPLDPFHLIYENNMAFIWDLWVTISSPQEFFHL